MLFYSPILDALHTIISCKIIDGVIYIVNEILEDDDIDLTFRVFIVVRKGIAVHKSGNDGIGQDVIGFIRMVIDVFYGSVCIQIAVLCELGIGHTHHGGQDYRSKQQQKIILISSFGLQVPC